MVLWNRVHLGLAIKALVGLTYQPRQRRKKGSEVDPAKTNPPMIAMVCGTTGGSPRIEEGQLSQDGHDVLVAISGSNPRPRGSRPAAFWDKNQHIGPAA